MRALAVAGLSLNAEADSNLKTRRADYPENTLGIALLRQRRRRAAFGSLHSRFVLHRRQREWEEKSNNKSGRCFIRVNETFEIAWDSVAPDQGLSCLCFNLSSDLR
ncbi:hypothetical protein B0H12DRAFT_597429 [Mycena haematopus]|nr:hypothetical protein B0H12DRAFT_597429 [Mycena haematopus]